MMFFLVYTLFSKGTKIKVIVIIIIIANNHVALTMY